MREGTIQPNGAAIRRLRKDHGWTQDDLAHRAGYAKRTIENAERDKPVLLRMLADIAQALGKDVQLKDLIAAEMQEPTGEATAISGPSSPARIGNAPPMPSLLIGRDTDLLGLTARLTQAVSRGKRPPIQVVTVVRGWPGVGKTSIARAIAHVPELTDAFPDGVLWASLGPSPSLLTELIVWGRALGDRDAVFFTNVAEASSRLAGLLRDRRMLLIVDDVWETSHAVPFNAGGRHCAMLVTTRLPSP